MSETRLYVDMDGTVAEYRLYSSDSQYDQLGYYSSLKPMSDLISALDRIQKENGIEIYIISACPKRQTSIDEKNEWLDRYMPFVKPENRVFTKIGESKPKAIDGGIKDSYWLLDDYKKNLKEWSDFGGRTIKCLNGINSDTKNIHHSSISSDQPTDDIVKKLLEIILENLTVKDSCDTVLLRNERDGLNIRITKKELKKIVDRYFPEFGSVEEFRRKLNAENWTFVRRVMENGVLESNSSIAQFEYEFRSFSEYLDTKLDGIRARFEKTMSSLAATIYDAAMKSIDGNDEARDFEATVIHCKAVWKAFIDDEIGEVNERKDILFGKHRHLLDIENDDAERDYRDAEKNVEDKIETCSIVTNSTLLNLADSFLKNNLNQ